MICFPSLLKTVGNVARFMTAIALEKGATVKE